MSHRAEDIYEFVALRDIAIGNVVGFREGDPVPASTVEERGLLDSEDVCRRDEWQGRPETEPERAMVRGEMPPHLKTQKEADEMSGAQAPVPASSRKSSTSKTTGSKDGG